MNDTKGLTVKELIEILQKHNPDSIVNVREEVTVGYNTTTRWTAIQEWSVSNTTGTVFIGD